MHCLRGAGRLACVALLMVWVASTVEAAITPISPADPDGALVFAQAMAPGEASTTLVTSAKWIHYGSCNTMVSPTIKCPAPDGPSALGPAGYADAALTEPFGIRDGRLVALMTTGLAAAADQPQSRVQSSDNRDRIGDVFDVTIIQIDLEVPSGHDCLAFDFQFLTEEPQRPEGQVTTGDIFLAELDANTLGVSKTGYLAQQNFAVARVEDKPVPATSFTLPFGTKPALLNPGNPDQGTVYDRGSQVWTARTVMAPAGGAHRLYLSFYERGLATQDSGVLLDKLDTFSSTQRPCGPEAPLAKVPPRIAFTASQARACGMNSVIFEDNSTTGSEALHSWEWDFGDGATGNGQKTNHTYASGGSYNVTLIVTDQGGMSNSTTVPIRVEGEVRCSNGVPEQGHDVPANTPAEQSRGTTGLGGGQCVGDQDGAAGCGSGGKGAPESPTAAGDFLTKHSRDPIPALLLVLAVGSGLMALRRWWPAIGGLYARLVGRDLLDLETRRQIVDFIRANPGSSYLAVAKRLEKGRGAVAYHLRVLVKGGALYRHEWQGTVGYHIAEPGTNPAHFDASAALRSKTAWRLLLRLAECSAAAPPALSAALGVSRNTIRYHLRRLSNARLIEVADGSTRREYLLTPLGRSCLQEAHGGHPTFVPSSDASQHA